ncbi:wat1-related protein at2g39510 [Phtheirospermum japonicum]|uniref:Wat1-related protein at2g39510 n=1 Tax=Phtheirospermum japonicum TaxID=374723 RepID=A0A830DCH5_9LAMI|nr:wat1-related protein at2g39510 [Phtheirospermum japonicum]
MGMHMFPIESPVIVQNMFYAGMRYSSATFAFAMCTLIPALTFVLAWILRIEKVNLKTVRSHAKIMGTLVTVGGAMIMTLIVGPVIGLPWTHKSHDNNASTNVEDPVKGAIMIAIGCLGYSLFYNLHAITLKSYPAGLSLTSMVCSLGAFIGTIVTFLAERGNTSVWALGWDAKLLVYVYGLIIYKLSFGFVLDIWSFQNWLELAWENGFDSPGKNYFDRKIHGKRNWIGTMECAAVFWSFGLRARIVGFCGKGFEFGRAGRKNRKVCGRMDMFLLKGKKMENCNISSETVKGHQVLCEWVWNYFSGDDVGKSVNRRVLSDKL